MNKAKFLLQCRYYSNDSGHTMNHKCKCNMLEGKKHS